MKVLNTSCRITKQTIRRSEKLIDQTKGQCRYNTQRGVSIDESMPNAFINSKQNLFFGILEQGWQYRHDYVIPHTN